VHLAVDDHVGVDPGADLRGDTGVEIELAVLGDAVRVPRVELVDERAAERDQLPHAAGLEAVLHHEAHFGGPLRQPAHQRCLHLGPPAVSRQVDDGVDLGGAEAGRVEQIARGAVLSEIDPGVGDDRPLAGGQEPVEGMGGRTVADREDRVDERVVEQALDDAPADRLIGVRHEHPGHPRFRSISCWTARRTWRAR